MSGRLHRDRVWPRSHVAEPYESELQSVPCIGSGCVDLSMCVCVLGCLWRRASPGCFIFVSCDDDDRY